MRALLLVLTLAATWLAALAPARANETVVAGLSQNRIAITANFDGSEILIFAAVKREAPAPEGPLEAIVTVAGPSTPVTVRRKDKRFGIWVNTDAVEVSSAPAFYAVNTSAPISGILTATEDQRHAISISNAIRSVGVASRVADPEAFTSALIRVRRSEGLYQHNSGAVQIDEATLLRTSVTLPANLTEGDYTMRIFLTRAGAVVDAYESQIFVQKVGLERWIFTLAHEHSLIYGLLSLAIAIAAGWAASAVFRYFRF